MWNSFEKLVQKNNDHYSEHPTSHTVIPAVVMIAAFAVMARVIRKSEERKISRRIHNPFQPK